MLLDLKEEEQRKIKGSMAALGVFVVGVIAAIMISAIKQSRLGYGSQASLTEGSTKALGQSLFGNFALPFEIISLVLLVAMIGAVLLSKKDLK
jgi:NADH-quinone oxidoreductase subunit J